jgi:DNA-binding transcriptional regulator YiaG
VSAYASGGPPERGPSPSGTPSGAPGPLDAILAARQEVATLRDVLETIQDALVAAATRLDALEVQLGGSPAPRDDDPALRPARTVAEWKLAGWTPTPAGAVVTGETLRARREALGISQAAVAHAAHCSRGLVAEVERGKRRSAQTLAHLSNTLDKLEQQARRN